MTGIGLLLRDKVTVETREDGTGCLKLNGVDVTACLNGATLTITPGEPVVLTMEVVLERVTAEVMPVVETHVRRAIEIAARRS